MEIDERLRNRVVGVSVITILTMIFLPMLLNEPKEYAQEITELSIPEKPFDTPSLTATLLPNNVDDVMKDITIPTIEIDPSPPPFIASTLKVVTTEVLETKRWFIQVASFNREENALGLRDKLRDQGFSATVNAVLSKGRNIYRLRVGPELSKQRAKKIKTKLNQQNNVKSIIILDH